MLCENILKVGICFLNNMSNFINGLKKFQVIPRELIFDNSLSDRARFVYCFMASKPDGWDFLLNPMAKELGYSVETLRKYINELIAGGWLKKGEQNNDGKFGAVVYTLLSTKKADTEKKRNEEIPTQENTDSENFRHGEKPTQYNKDNKENKESIEKKDLQKKERKDKSFPKKKTKFDAYADLSYVDAAYADIWKEWLEYKGAINKQYNAQKGAIIQYKSLLKYADNNVVLANAIVKRSIEHSWQGLFELNDKDKALYLSERSPYYTKSNTLPNGWTQERYDMYIRNGYTITEDGRLFKDGREIK